MTESLKPRLLSAAQLMRDLSVELNARATIIDKRPEGFTGAFRLIVLARDLGSVARRLSAAAREMGQ